MLKFLLIGVFIVVAIAYSVTLMGNPSTPEIITIPNPVKNDREVTLNPEDSIAVTLPADENSTISTEVVGAGGIAGVGKPTVVNITSGNK